MRNKIAELSTADYLTAVSRRILTTAAMSAAYSHWADDFSRREVRETWDDSGRLPWARRIQIQDLDALSDGDLQRLGFAIWEDGHWLIPLWAWNYIADGERVISISGNEAIKGSDEIDLDVRGGCIAWGWKRPTTA